MTSGSKYFGDGGITYALLMANGRGPDFGRKDVNDHKATAEKLIVHVPTRNFFNTLDFGVLLYQDKLENRDRESIYGFETRIEKGRFGFLGEFAHADIKYENGLRKYFRQGFYLQPWLRVARQINAVYRYDTLNFDSRLRHPRDASRHTFGLNFRPRPQVSLKLEFNRNSPADTLRLPFNGVGASVTLFFQ